MKHDRNPSRKKLASGEQPTLPRYDWEDLNPIFLTKKDVCNLVCDIAERDKIPDSAISEATGFSKTSGNRLKKWLDTESPNWMELEAESCLTLVKFLREYYDDVIPPHRAVVIVTGVSYGS